MIAAHGREFATGAFVLAARWISEGKMGAKPPTRPSRAALDADVGKSPQVFARKRFQTRHCREFRPVWPDRFGLNCNVSLRSRRDFKIPLVSYTNQEPVLGFYAFCV